MAITVCLALLWAGQVSAQQAVADEARPQSQVTPLSAEHAAIFWGSVEDAAPSKLNATRRDLEGRHYLTGDELNLQLFMPQIENIGGAYAGVGADQAYLFIGWQRPEIAWLTDYDPWIKWLHRCYHVFFETSQTPDEFVSWWDKKNKKKATSLLEQAFAGTEDGKKSLDVFRVAQRKTFTRLKRMRRLYRRQKVASYLTDQQTYDFVRAMVMAKRVRPLLVNLIDTTGMKAMAEANRKMGIPLRVLYTSNAEGYWRYPDTFKENIAAQFTDDKSVLVRTDPTKKRNKDYAYFAQSFSNFGQWLNAPFVKRVRDIIPRYWVKDESHIPYMVVDGPPTEKKKKKKRR